MDDGIMKSKKGFTLVELLIVVVILGLLAAIVIPRFSSASSAARASMLADDLRILRIQIAVFRAQHIGVAAGYPDCDTSQAPTEADFIAQVTMASKATGETAAPGTAGFDFGPYLREMPVNPVNGKSTVQIIVDAGVVPAVADDSDGWIYQPSTLTIKADSTGIDDAGKAYIDY